MPKLTSKKVQDYMSWRSGEKLKHCPDCIAAACNDARSRFGHRNAKDFMKLLFFNDPIPRLHTHDYGFHTATGRNIIQTLQEYYYKFEKLEI